MYLLHLRPLFVELPIIVLGGLVLLEPRDLVREQTCRNLRRGAADPVSYTHLDVYKRQR